MPLTQLNKEQVHQAILVGCQSLIDQKEMLNQINVGLGLTIRSHHLDFYFRAYAA